MAGEAVTVQRNLRDRPSNRPRVLGVPGENLSQVSCLVTNWWLTLRNGRPPVSRGRTLSSGRCGVPDAY